VKGEPLPNASRAIVAEAKITQYLLSDTHPDGSGKARFFAAHGFSLSEWGVLAAALRDHATAHPVAEAVQTPFGSRYTIEGALTSPDGRAPGVRVVWFVRAARDVPELVTAYPMKRRP
jgi:hypothetical protein